MARKWIQLVGEDGRPLTLADAVDLEIEDVAALRKAVKEEYKDSYLVGIAPSDLTVFDGDGGIFTRSSSSVTDLGKDEDYAIIVQVPQRAEIAPSYFILPETREKVSKAVFVIVEDNDHNGVGMGVFKGVGMGVFFSATLAVTCDHNLTDQDTVGSSISLALKDEITDVIVVARNGELDFAILKSSQPRAFVPPWNGSTDDLESRCDLVLASFRLGIDEYQEPYKSKLGFAPAACIAISSHRRHIMYSCPTYAGDSGAALIMKDGCLVGIHQETINGLREAMERKKVIQERLSDVEESLDNIANSGLAQGCSGLLVHEFKDVVSE